MNGWSVFGIVCGVGTGLLLLLLALKLTKTNGSVRCKFDERQQLIRGKGFKYAFFTLLIYDALFACVKMADGRLPMEDAVAMMIGISLGAAVYAIYCIWKEGYFSLNENPRRLMVVFAAIAALNLWLSWSSFREGTLVENGVLTYHACNLVCSLLMLVILIALAVKWIVNQREGE